MIEAFYRLRRTLADPLAFALSRRELHRLMESDELESIVDATETYQGRGFYARIHAIQHHSEILELARQVRELDVKRFVEIGSYKGGTLFIFCRAALSLEHAVSIDLPGGDYGGGYDRRRERLFREFLHRRPAARLDCLRVDSHAPETRAALERALGGEEIDFLYIDGDHRLEGVRQDFEDYSPLVRPGGLVAFHDIITREPGHHVHQFWREIKDDYVHEELIAQPDGNKGIGILRM